MTAVHTVAQGECLSSIAKTYGFGTWRTIYEHADNAEFRKQRPNPNVIYPGDEVVIPARDRKQEAGATEQRHHFKLKPYKTLLRIRLQERDGKVLAGKKYQLWVEDVKFEGTTDGNGVLEQEIPATATNGTLTLRHGRDNDEEEEWAWPLSIGHLDPVEEVSGVQARLRNLAYFFGPVNGEMTPRTADALKAFQAEAGLHATGELDENTKKRLLQMHEAV